MCSGSGRVNGIDTSPPSNSLISHSFSLGCIRITICVTNWEKAGLGNGERPASETGSTDDGLLDSSKNKHNPVMVYNDLMINNTSVSNYNINRSQPTPADRDALPQPCSDLGSDYCSFLPYGFSATICGTLINVNYIYCLITLATLVAHPQLGLI